MTTDLIEHHQSVSLVLTPPHSTECSGSQLPLSFEINQTSDRKSTSSIKGVALDGVIGCGVSLYAIIWVISSFISAAVCDVTLFEMRSK